MLKILVIGETNTGKTSLVNRYVQNEFKEDVGPTIACEFALKVQNIDGKSVRVQVWDIAGQDRIGSISKLYCRDAVGAVVVCDCTKPATLKLAAEWKKQVDEHVQMPDKSPLPMLLLANKYDIREKAETPITESMLQEAASQGSFAGQYFTSAKHGHNVDQAFIQLLREIQKHDLGTGGDIFMAPQEKRDDPQRQEIQPMKLHSKNNKAPPPKKTSCC